MDRYLVEVAADSPWTRDGWLRTGDLGRFLPDGQLDVRGRRDHLIITGGENVAPQEVEAWLEAMPGIRAACVFSVPDDEWGERVVAAIAADVAELDLDALRARMRAELAPHKRPKGLAVLDALPLNRSGKLDRAAIRSRSLGLLRPI
jgi:acyl-CoA synthetase (AMP-forming)/AMP-acid ligase II